MGIEKDGKWLLDVSSCLQGAGLGCSRLTEVFVLPVMVFDNVR